METIQQQINTLQTSVKRQRFAIIALAGIIVASGFIAAVRPVGDATFDTITCNAWRVVDKDGKTRIYAAALHDGSASMNWFDKDEKLRITASTLANGTSSFALSDKDEKLRISASTRADGNAIVALSDKDNNGRIMAATLADGTVFLPTQDDHPPKKP